MLSIFAVLMFAAEPPKPMIAATVNGEEIPLSRVQEQIRKRLAVDSATVGKQLRREVLDDLIDDVLLKQFLEKNAPAVPADDIDKQMIAFTASLEKTGDTLAKFLDRTKQTETELRDSWMQIARLDAYIRKTTTDDDLKRHWSENRDHFDRTEVKASHILFRCSEKAPDRDAVKAKAEAIRKDIAAGRVDFADAAKKLSQCPSKSEGGDIGWFPRKGAMVEEFAKAAFKLKPGEMEIVQTEFGMHLIRVTDRKAGKGVPFEKCIDEVRESYADEQRPVLVAKQRKDAVIQITLP